MRLIKTILCWYFWCLSVVFVGLAKGVIEGAIHGENTSRPLLNQIAIVSIPPILVAIFGTAWWTVWRKRSSARVWAVTACITNLAFSIGIPLLYFYAQGANSFWWMESIFGPSTAIGIAGLIVFLPVAGGPFIDRKEQL
jgi:hypothetical protein